MTSQSALASQWLKLSDHHEVNVTSRSSLKNGDADKLTDLTVATIRMWKQVVNAFQKGEEKLDVTTSPESALSIPPYTGDPAVTVWGDLDSSDKKGGSLTVHSFMTAQAALNVLWANHRACNKVREALAEAAKKVANGVQQPTTTPPAPAPNNPPTPPPPAPPSLGNVKHIGDFDAKDRFEDGEVLSFVICKVQRKTTDKGKPFYRLVSTFKGSETKYPSDKLSVREDNEGDMKTVGASLTALNIAVGGEATVNWRYVVKVRHGSVHAKTGLPTQYFNPVRIEAIQQVAPSSF